MKINLRDFYPFYTKDFFVEVNDTIVYQLLAWQRKEQANRRRMFRYQAHYSLDRNDGIENDRLDSSLVPDAIYEQKEVHEQLRIALSNLPEKQAQRITAHYVLGVKMVDIARAEGVTKAAVTISIQRGLNTMKKLLKEIL